MCVCRWRCSDIEKNKSPADDEKSSQSSLRPERGQSTWPECTGQWIPALAKRQEQEVEEAMVRRVQPGPLRVWKTRGRVGEEKHHIAELSSGQSEFIEHRVSVEPLTKLGCTSYWGNRTVRRCQYHASEIVGWLINVAYHYFYTPQPVATCEWMHVHATHFYGELTQRIFLVQLNVAS